MQKILFISSGRIGDAIMATGLLGWLLDNRPSARFTIAAGPLSTPLFAAFPRLDRLITVTKRPYNRHWLTLWNDTRRTQWDMVVDLRGSLLGYLVPTRERRIFRHPDTALPKAEQLAALFGLNPAPPTRLWTNDAARAAAKALLPEGPVILLAPCTNSAAKDWPIERFAELANRLKTGDTMFAILGTERDKTYVRPLVEALPGKVLNLCGKTDMLTAMAVMERAKLFIGNDSGLLHMAAAMGTKCVGIYGPSNDKTYAPRGKHVRIVTSHDFKPGEEEKRDVSYILKITVDEVERAARELLA